MRIQRIVFVLVAVATVVGAVVFTTLASEHADGDAAPIFGIKIPGGYRDWRLISMAHEEATSTISAQFSVTICSPF